MANWFQEFFCKNLVIEHRLYRERNVDLAAQVQELCGLNGTKLMTPAQLEGIATMRAEHAEMAAEQRKIGLYLRREFAAEIERGEHAGMSLSDLLIKYLSRVKHDAA